MHFLEDLNDDQQRWYLRHLGGETITQIASSEGIKRTTLSSNITKIRQIVRDRFNSKIQEMKEATSESLQWKIRELHRAWQLSKHPTIQTKFKKVVRRQGNGTPLETDPEFSDDEWQEWECERIVTEKLPDARYLTEARHCEEMLADWWGYGTSDPRNKDDDENANGMTDEDLVQQDLDRYVEEYGEERIQEMLTGGQE